MEVGICGKMPCCQLCKLDGWKDVIENMDEMYEDVKELVRAGWSRVGRGWPNPVSQRADVTRSNGG